MICPLASAIQDPTLLPSSLPPPTAPSLVSRTQAAVAQAFRALVLLPLYTLTFVCKAYLIAGEEYKLCNRCHLAPGESLLNRIRLGWALARVGGELRGFAMKMAASLSWNTKDKFLIINAIAQQPVGDWNRVWNLTIGQYWKNFTQDEADLLIERYVQSGANLNEEVTGFSWLSEVGTATGSVLSVAAFAASSQRLTPQLHSPNPDQWRLVLALLKQPSLRLDGYARVTYSYEVTQRSALHWAAEAGALEAVKVLVERGAQIEIGRELFREGAVTHITPIDYAAQAGRFEVVRYLRGKGAYFGNASWLLTCDLTAYLASFGDREPESDWLEKVEKYLELGAAPINNSNPFTTAVVRHHAGCAKRLIEYGFNPFAKNQYGHMPFGLECDQEILELYLKDDRLDVTQRVPGPAQCSVLLYAILKDVSDETYNHLKARGAVVPDKDEVLGVFWERKSPLAWARDLPPAEKRKRILKRLQEIGASVESYRLI